MYDVSFQVEIQKFDANPTTVDIASVSQQWIHYIAMSTYHEDTPCSPVMNSGPLEMDPPLIVLPHSTDLPRSHRLNATDQSYTNGLNPQL